MATVSERPMSDASARAAVRLGWWLSSEEARSSQRSSTACIDGRSDRLRDGDDQRSLAAVDPPAGSVRSRVVTIGAIANATEAIERGPGVTALMPPRPSDQRRPGGRHGGGDARWSLLPRRWIRRAAQRAAVRTTLARCRRTARSRHAKGSRSSSGLLSGENGQPLAATLARREPRLDDRVRRSRRDRRAGQGARRGCIPPRPTSRHGGDASTVVEQAVADPAPRHRRRQCGI